MQHEEHAKAQSKRKGARVESPEALLEILKMQGEDKEEMWSLLQMDPIKALYDLPEYLCPHKIRETREQKEKYASLEEKVREITTEFSKADPILCLANAYGMVSQERGFREGFSMAFRLWSKVMGWSAL